MFTRVVRASSFRRDAVSKAATFAPPGATGQKLHYLSAGVGQRDSPISTAPTYLTRSRLSSYPFGGPVTVAVVAYQHGIGNEISVKTHGRLKAMASGIGDVRAWITPVRLAFSPGILNSRACHYVGAGANQHNVAAPKWARFLVRGLGITRRQSMGLYEAEMGKAPEATAELAALKGLPLVCHCNATQSGRMERSTHSITCWVLVFLRCHVAQRRRLRTCPVESHCICCADLAARFSLLW